MKPIINRLIIAIPLLILISFLSFMIMHLAPGDPTVMMMDPKISAQDLSQFKKNLGLDQPLYQQYIAWLIQISKGNLGYSLISGKPVVNEILARLPATLLLNITSLILIVLITFPIGLISGAKKGSIFDHTVTFITFIGLAIPSFWLGLMLILFFSLKLNLFPSSGWLDPIYLNAGIWTKSINIAWHLILPLTAVTVSGLAGLTRYTRFGVIDVLNQDYIRAARARGIPERTILAKHALKNAALPMVTLLGLQLPAMIAGSFIIEYIFAWPGMGQLGLAAVFSRDYPILMATLMATAILIIIGNLLSDITYRLIDPRIKTSS